MLVTDWLVLGPPCSSLVGLFSELGPFVTGNDGKTLLPNAGRWNQQSNLLFIENPSGVGFSYNPSETGYDHDDNDMAKANMEALQAFYASFPEFGAQPLYIAGESYAGVYVPMLAQLVVRHNTAQVEVGAHINLQGILVGNGAIATGDWYEGWLQELRMEHLFAHGLFSPTLHGQIRATCTNFTKGSVSAECTALLAQMHNQTGNLNQYNIRETCLAPQQQLLLQGGAGSEQTALDGRRAAAAAGAGASVGVGAGAEGVVGGKGEGEGYDAQIDPCDLGSKAMIAYLNQPAVLKALHVEEAVPAVGRLCVARGVTWRGSVVRVRCLRRSLDGATADL